MTPAVFSLLTVAGGAGAVTRFRADSWLRSRWSDLQWPTSVINLTGSFALGLLTGLAEVDVVSSGWNIVIGTGFLGGYTTFSTASLETVQLIRSGRAGRALLGSLGTLVGCVAVAALGLWIGDQM